MSNIEISIKINISETNACVKGDHSAEQMGDGYFRLILDDSSALDINALEKGLLKTNYPALRDALAKHLESEIKKSHKHSAKLRRYSWSHTSRQPISC